MGHQGSVVGSPGRVHWMLVSEPKIDCTQGLWCPASLAVKVVFSFPKRVAPALLKSTHTERST